MLNKPKNIVLANDTEKNKNFISGSSYKENEIKPSIKIIRKKKQKLYKI